MKLQLAKGVRDNGPKEQIVRQRIIDTIKSVFESYGFLPLDTPIIERFDVLSSKYAGGAEILKETFKMTDQGGRELCLRYDLTVPLCRYVGMNPNVKLPFKRYQVGSVFRDGPIKLGRYREFMQVDADIVGAKGMMAETTLISIISDVFEKLGMKIRVEVNNRKLLDGLLLQNGVKKDELTDFILSVDKLKKMGELEVSKELISKGFSQDIVEKALSSLNGSLNDLEVGAGQGTEGLTELKELFALLDSAGLPDSASIEFNPALARGLSYYTGTVFEAFIVDSKIKGSVSAGGRYDNMISDFLGSKQDYPAVGVSFGLDVIKDAVEVNDLESVAKVFIIPISTQTECLKIARLLRSKGIKTDIDLMGRGLSKNLNYANSLSIPFVLIVGEDELKENKVMFRDMKSGNQKLLSLDDVVSKVKN